MVNVFHNLRIVDYKLKGNKLESLTVAYDNSNVIVTNGFSKDDRLELGQIGDSLMGRIVQIKCKGGYPLFHLRYPIYKCLLPIGSMEEYNAKDVNAQ